jgi:hypothetical protein
MPDEIEHRQARLVVGQSQATAELLQEHGRTFRWPKKRDGVDLWHVDAFIEQVHCEHDIDFPCSQRQQRRAALG